MRALSARAADCVHVELSTEAPEVERVPADSLVDRLQELSAGGAVIIAGPAGMSWDEVLDVVFRKIMSLPLEEPRDLYVLVEPIKENESG